MMYILRNPLKQYGRKSHSQNDEDGIIEAIFQDISPHSKYFVEFGIGPNWLDKDYSGGLEGNCVELLKKGWSGLMMDGQEHPSSFNVKQEFLTPFNINSILRKHSVPHDVDLISIDVDGQDLWIWLALQYRPLLFIIEFNPNFLSLHDSVSVVLDPAFRWDGTKYYGASLGALIKIGKEKGYKLIYANTVNAFFVRADCLANSDDFSEEELFVSLDQHHHDHFHRPWVTI
jgi:hypothetical protein